MIRLYDQDCPVCGVIVDAMRTVDERLICDVCGGPCKVLLGSNRPSGPLPSNPIKVLGSRKVFDDPNKFKAWQRENPHLAVVSVDGRERRELHDSMQHKADKAAKGMGFKDRRHYQGELKKSRERGERGKNEHQFFGPARRG